MNSVYRQIIIKIAVFATLYIPVFTHAAENNSQKEKMHTITFSELIIRTNDSVEISSVTDGIKVQMIEELRKNGFNALGAENIVFGKDKSDEATFALGGTVTKLNCKGLDNVYADSACQIMITWELFDTRVDAVIYKVDTTSKVESITDSNKAEKFKSLFSLALQSLMSRSKFKEFLTIGSKDIAWEKKEYKTATIKKCEAEKLTLPEDAPKVIAATVIIESGNGFGSGALISPDGYILTAAHVVNSDESKIIFEDGKEATAKLIRFDKTRDTALLKIPGKNYQCIIFAAEQAKVGSQIFAIGTPESKDLSFSVSSGIVSGLRKWEDAEFLQTDASLNPGNSGGPIIDHKGELLAVVSWKLSGIGIEGVGFGIPVNFALSTLSIEQGAESSDNLSTLSENDSLGDDKIEAYVDTPDLYKSIDNEDELTKTVAIEQKKQTPKIYYPLSFGGLGLVVIGATMVGTTYMRFTSDNANYGMDYDQYKTRKNLNTVGWIMAGAGVAAFITSLFLRPSKSKIREQLKQKEQKKVSMKLEVSPTFANMKVSF
ncbi:MAG: serine protease [Deltaproteobacteria bacterium]|nr:serine protease [Deltaproteobacteria bacterium]